ncbi:MAG: TolC family protein [Deltaproteobacteria bacterium]|nr:TolC family protein [Deltaproteobacteria bacterium]
MNTDDRERRFPRRAAAAALLALTPFWSGAALAAEPGARVIVPIGSGQRQAQPLPEGEKIELTLAQAIEFALRNTLDLDVASLTYQRTGFSIGAASGAFDPSLTAAVNASSRETPTTSSFQAPASKAQRFDLGIGGLTQIGTEYSLGFVGERSDSPTKTPIPGYVEINPKLETGLTASVTQPILRGFGRDVNTRLVVQSRLLQDASAWDFVVTIQNAVQLVENAYWDLVYANANLESKKEALDRANDFNRITKIKIDVGALAPIEIVQTEVTIAQREQEIILAEGQIGDAQDRLKRLLNVTDLSTWSRPIVPMDKPSEEKVTIDVEAGIRSAIEVRPEVKQALVDIESKKVSLVFNRNELKPRLDAKGSYGLAGVGYNNDAVTEGSSYSGAISQIGSVDYPNWSIGLAFSVPLGNRTAKANAAIAATDLDLANTNLALLKQNLSLEVRTAARNVDTARRSVAAAKKGRELADRNLDAERKKFDNGMTTSFTVAQVQNDLSTARSNELLAIAGYLKSMVSWHKAVGDLLQVKNVEIAGLPVPIERAAAEEGARP